MPDVKTRQRVRTTLEGSCLTITLNYPERRNPLSNGTAMDLAAALKAANEDPAVRAVVITGAGGHFSAGGNLHELLENTKQGGHVHWQEGACWVDLFKTLMSMSKPTIAKVRGAAMAGGCGLVAAADFAFAADDAVFGVPEAKIGLFPLQIMPALFRVIGRRKTLELTLTGRTISAQEAARIGLINAAISDDALDAEVAKLVAELVVIGPLTMAMGKRAFAALTELSLNDALEAGRDFRVPFLGSPELKAGIERFLDRRSQEGM